MSDRDIKKSMEDRLYNARIGKHNTLEAIDVFNVIKSAIELHAEYGAKAFINVDFRVDQERAVVEIPGGRTLFLFLDKSERVTGVSTCIVSHPPAGYGDYDIYHQDASNANVDKSDAVFNLLENNNLLDKFLILIAYYDNKRKLEKLPDIKPLTSKEQKRAAMKAEIEKMKQKAAITNE